MTSGQTPHIYGGFWDGAESIRCNPTDDKINIGRGYTYVRSAEWSAHFKKPTFIPLGFPGRPPQLAAA